MANNKSKSSSSIDYIWSILMIICISLLTVHLVISAKSTAGKDNKVIEQTFVKR